MTDAVPELDAIALLTALAQDDVRFVVIGGFAVIAHGVVRATKDVDVVVAPVTDNYQALSRSLTGGRLAPSEFLWESGFLTLDLDDEFDLARGTTYRLATPFGWLDVLNRPAGAPAYEELEQEAVEVPLGGTTIRVASLQHLMAMKRVADRPRDRLDLGELRALQEPDG